MASLLSGLFFGLAKTISLMDGFDVSKSGNIVTILENLIPLVTIEIAETPFVIVGESKIGIFQSKK